MIKNYFKTAWRNIIRNKTYSILNTAGLSVGIAACLLIFLVIQYQLSFDNFHPKKENIYRIGSVFHNDDGIDYSDAVSLPVAGGLRIDYPQIKEVASILRTDGQITVDHLGSSPEKIIEKDFYYAEPQFFSIFNFPFLEGSANTSLKDPNNAVLTKAAAEKYFGDWKNAMGKSFTFENKTRYTVTGILKDIPANSDFPLGVVVPYSSIKQSNFKLNLDDWVSVFGGASTYLVLPENMSVASMNRSFDAFAKRHKPAEYNTDGYVLQPLSEIHFDERFGNYNRKTFSHKLVNILALIGLFLLVIACVNFINLATAQAVNRSKEVGIRKVLGSSRKQLVIKFLSEIALVVLGATIVAVGVAYLSLPFLNKLLETKISINFFLNPQLLLFLVVTVIMTTLLSGFYPALVLSGFNPIKALKNKIVQRSSGAISLRRGLVVFQFAIAQVLIIAMLIVVSQLQYFRNASLGFDKSQIVNVNVPTDSLSRSKIDFLRNKLLSNPAIEDVSFSFASPSSNSNWNSDFRYDHAEKTSNFNANLKWADPEYFTTYKLQFVAGKAYDPTDTVRDVVVNETLLKKLGVTDPQKAIGKEIDLWDGGVVATISGVIRDFNSYSLRDPVSPVILGPWKRNYRIANIKIKPHQDKAAMSFIENLWNTTYPQDVYVYKFLDDTINKFYEAEDQLSILYKIFAGIAIFISCLGLYGLVSFMAVQRTKEVGVRKVLGASALNIVYLMSREFTMLVLLSFVVSAPIAFFVMKKWLQDYTYRIQISPVIFLVAITGSVLIAWITVGHRAIKAANANPVKSLRTE